MLFFFALIFIGESVVINLAVGVIVSAYEEEKEKQENVSRQLKNVRSVSSVLTSAIRKSTKFTSDAVKKSASSLRKGSVVVNQQLQQLANLRNAKTPEPELVEVNGCGIDEEEHKVRRLEQHRQHDHRLSPLERGRERISALFSLEMACYHIAESSRFDSVVMSLIMLNTAVLACECMLIRFFLLSHLANSLLSLVH